MRLFLLSVLLLSVVIGLANSQSIEIERVVDGGSGSEQRNAFCQTCSESDHDNNPDCEDWTVKINWEDYDVWKFICGCDSRIKGKTQCKRKNGSAAEELQAAISRECGVTAQCQVSLSDGVVDNDHDCDASCGFLFFFCNAECDTRCRYIIKCEAEA
jgi:hypothetical protein